VGFTDRSSTPQWRPGRDIVAVPSARDYGDRNHKKFERGRRDRNALERRVLQVSTSFLIAGAASCFWLLHGELGPPVATAPLEVLLQTPTTKIHDGVFGKSESLAASTHPWIDPLQMSRDILQRDCVGAFDSSPPVCTSGRFTGPAGDNSGSLIIKVGGRWSGFGTESDLVNDGDLNQVKQTEGDLHSHFAAVESPASQTTIRRLSILHRIPPDGNQKTTLVDFGTAPFPYDGVVPGSNKPFLDIGEPGHRGHTNFRGRVFWEAETFSDRRVLLHIPRGFNVNRPGVMVVFFHGHGANLARDVRDRQQVPAQISASGVNAVLVAPQFAVNAADSSPGKFWEVGGFKRFVNEAAEQLARLQGDPRAAQVFGNMPIVIVAYSGGFEPTLWVLERGGVQSRVRGVILLDALYGGIRKFANWIASDRSTFFVSSYTPHTQRRNAELEQILSGLSVSYTSELRRSHLPGSVTFLPVGDISHRDFVTRAWVSSPIKDILLRLDDHDLGGEAATTATASSSRTAAARPRRD